MKAFERRINMLAVDIGAGSGRFILGKYEDGKLDLEEIGRFEHHDCLLNGILYWDFQDIYNQVKSGIHQAISVAGRLDSIGFDSFAPDFICFSEDGYPIGQMLSYRNFQCEESLYNLLSITDADTFAEICGNAPLSFSLLPQLMFLQKRGLITSGRRVYPLPLANALAYLFSNRIHTDRTQSSISMLCDRSGYWSKELTERFLIPPLVLPEILPCGTILGNMSIDGTETQTAVVNVGSHDTACANSLLAAKAQGELLINAGTWISVGTATDAPIAGKVVDRADLFNYGLPEGNNLLCRLSYGMGLIRMLKNRMSSNGYDESYSLLGELAVSSSYDGVFSVYDPELFAKDLSIEAIVRSLMCRQNCPPPESFADIVRAVYASLASNIAARMQDLQSVTGRNFHAAYLGGGGIQDRYFTRCIEKSTGLTVVPMPAESTAIGNMRMQLHALGIHPNTL